jgi:hypothetical protein
MNLMIDTEELKEFQQFWHRVWVSQEDFLEEEDLRRDANPVYDVEVPKTFKVLRDLPGVFRNGDILVRDEYEEARKAIVTYEETQNAAIVVGHPGIGAIRLW